VNVQVPLDRIDRSAFQPLPALPPLPNTPSESPDSAASAPLPVRPAQPQPLQTRGQRAAFLRDVKAIQVDPTVVGIPDKVKEDFAASLLEDSLRSALRDANFDTPDSAAVRAHIVLDEFSSGSTAKRFLVGMGAGRSTVDGRLVFQDATGRELANVRIRVRGNLAWSSYQGGNRQRSQATNSFEERLAEEIARLK
jgi:hypothetical protein